MPHSSPGKPTWPAVVEIAVSAAVDLAVSAEGKQYQPYDPILCEKVLDQAVSLDSLEVPWA